MPSFIDRFAERFPALAKVKFDRDIKREMKLVDSQVNARTSAAPALVDLDRYKAVWKIAVPGQEDRFMSLRSGHNDEHSFVVMVDAEKFYRAWLTRAVPVEAQGRMDQCVLRGDMHRDYKYKWAAEGFGHGRENPVPLAQCHMSKYAAGNTSVGFTNGVTRTFWLLANRAESFPVEVSNKASARALHRVAGIGSAPMTAAVLFTNAHELQAKVSGEQLNGPIAGKELLEKLRNEMRSEPAGGKPGHSYSKLD